MLVRKSLSLYFSFSFNSRLQNGGLASQCQRSHQASNVNGPQTLMFCCHHQETLNTFIPELVFCQMVGLGPPTCSVDDAQEHGIPGSMEFKYMGCWELEEYLDCTRLSTWRCCPYGDREAAFPCEPELASSPERRC